MRSLISWLLCAVLVQGCGLKGPLYIPTPAEKREMAEREKRLEEREKKEQQQQASQPEQSQQ